MVVGAPDKDNGNDIDEGVVYVFTPQVETWTKEKSLTENDGESDKNLGLAFPLVEIQL